MLTGLSGLSGLTGIASGPSDSVPPVISAVTVSNITETSADISWTTDENSDSAVEYGPTSAYGASVTDPNLVTAHALSLASLTPLTAYHYRVLSEDASGNQSASVDGTFSTVDLTAPVFANLVVSETQTATNLAGAILTGTFDTNEPGSTRFEYSVNADFSASSLTTEIDTATRKTTGHSQTITGLTAKQTYYVRARTKDSSGNERISDPVTVTTKWTPALLNAGYWIEAPRESTADGAAVQTPTDWANGGAPAPTQTTAAVRPIYRRANPSYANGISCWDFGIVGQTINWTTNGVDRDNLDCAADHFQLVVYRCPATQATDQMLMCHSDAVAATLRWALRLKTTGAAAVFNDGKGSDQLSSLTQFCNGTNYGLLWNRVGTTTTFSWNVQDDVNTFTGMSTTTPTGGVRVGQSTGTSAPFKGEIVMILSRNSALSSQERAELWTYLTATMGYLTNPDTVAPTITNTSIVEATIQTALAGGTATLSWVTNEPATSRAEVSTSPDFSGSVLTTLDGSLVTNHVHTVPNLNAETRYYVRAISADASANSTTGPSVTIDTSISLHQTAPIWWIDASLNTQSDNTTTQTPNNYGSDQTIVFTNITVAQRPTWRSGSMAGAPCWETDGINDNWQAANPSGLDLTGDCTKLYVVSTTQVTEAVLMSRFSAGGTERWGARLNNVAGKFGVNEDGKGSVQNTTYDRFNDGRVYAIMTVRSGTTETVYVWNQAHDVFTGMSNTDPDGDATIGMAAGTGLKLQGQIGLMAVWNVALDAGQRALAWQYVS